MNKDELKEMMDQNINLTLEELEQVEKFAQANRARIEKGSKRGWRANWKKIARDAGLVIGGIAIGSFGLLEILGKGKSATPNLPDVSTVVNDVPVINVENV